MDRECREFQEEIWELAVSGRKPEGHVAGCEACLRVLEEAKKALSMLRESDCVPDAPDCRAAVISQISRPARRRFVRAYVLAPVAVAVLALAAVVFWPTAPKSSPHPGPLPPGEREVSLHPTPRPLVEKEVVASSGRKTPARGRVAVVHVPGVSLAVHHMRTRLVVVQKSVSQPKEVCVATAERVTPVGSIAISCRVGPDETSSSCKYSVRNTETGDSYTCSAERKGNTISLYLVREPSTPDHEEGG